MVSFILLIVLWIKNEIEEKGQFSW